MSKCGCPNHGMFDFQVHTCSRKADHSKKKGCKCLCGKRWTYNTSGAVEIQES